MGPLLRSPVAGHKCKLALCRSFAMAGQSEMQAIGPGAGNIVGGRPDSPKWHGATTEREEKKPELTIRQAFARTCE